MKKILVVDNSAWNIYNFRTPHIRQLAKSGYETVVVTPIDAYYGYIKGQSFMKHIPLKHLQPQSKNPIQDILFLWELIQIYRRERPSLVIHFTIKPNIYGSLAARWLGIPTISIFTGLGYTFLHWKGAFRLVPRLCKIAFRNIRKLVLYNQDDLETIVSQQIAPREVCGILHGSGVNIKHFRPLPPTDKPDNFIFLFIGRLLYDKGLEEVVNAIKSIQAMGRKAECWVVGDFTYTNPSAVPHQQLYEWAAHKSIRYFGVSDDVRQFIRNADVLVLPSYGEGVPRVILEAMAMGKPIITADSPGCKDTVVHGENGLIVPPKDVASLREAMLYMLDIPDADLAKMGRTSRRMAVENFDKKLVAARFADIVKEILPPPHEKSKSKKRKKVF